MARMSATASMVAAHPNGAEAVHLFVVALLLVVGLVMSAPSARAEAAITVPAHVLAATVSHSIDDISAQIGGRSAPAAHEANGQPLVHCLGTLCCGSVCQTMAELGNPTQFPLPVEGQDPLPPLSTAPCEAPVRDAFRPPIA